MSYVVEMRRKLHMYPEIGFELPRTLELVRGELAKMGLPFTEEYGKSSIVATLNEEKENFTIGIRADMDALEIEEKTKLPYKSRIKGQMHACGHDAHTAILLDAARQLVGMKEKINCRVKFIFQSAEEYPPSGAKLMVEDGVMDDIDCIIALHCDSLFHVGTIGITAGPQNAISSGFHLDFYGKNSHAARQQDGVDAIMMAVKAYTAIEMMVAKEVPALDACLFNAGSIHGGTTNNIICNHCSLYCTLRTWREDTDAQVTNRIKQIIRAVAKESGGRATYTQDKYYPIVRNAENVKERLEQAAVSVVGRENVSPNRRTVGGEDFAYFAARKPGCVFRLGIRNPEKDCIYSVHQDKYNLDEDALKIGSDIFVQFVLQNMDGF
ncbi:MAG: amidohydrolase [Faecalimonas sp.]|nr:amidohydrolase [Faecalimonas sp.]